MSQIICTSESKTKHKICFTTPFIFKDKLSRMFEKEKDSLTALDVHIASFNKNNDGLITEYYYEIVDDYNFKVVLLFKQLFRAMGVSQKYAKCTVNLADTKINIKFDCNLDIKLRSKGSYDHMPLVYIRASYEKFGDLLKHEIEYETTDDIKSYACYLMLMDSIREGIIKLINEIEVVRI